MEGTLHFKKLLEVDEDVFGRQAFISVGIFFAYSFLKSTNQT